MTTPLERLRYHISGAVARGEKEAIVGIPYAPLTLTLDRIDHTPSLKNLVAIADCAITIDATQVAETMINSLDVMPDIETVSDAAFNKLCADIRLLCADNADWIRTMCAESGVEYCDDYAPVFMVSATDEYLNKLYSNKGV